MKKDKLQEKLEEMNFKKVDTSDIKGTPKGTKYVYAGKISNLGGEDYFLSLHKFKECYQFTISDNIGIVKLSAFKLDTPIEILVEYIKRAYRFFSV